MKTTLKKLNPCEGGYKFAESKNSLIEAWNTCERGDWMLWFASKLDCPVELLTLAKATCTETVMHLMRDERSRNAVKVAIDFGNGVATREELDAAAADAFAAYAAYDYAFAAYAAYAAASNAADSAAYAADSAAYAAAAAYTTAAAFAAFAAAAADVTADVTADTPDADEDAFAYADAAKKENQLKTANICRLILTDFIKSVLTNKIEG